MGPVWLYAPHDALGALGPARHIVLATPLVCSDDGVCRFVSACPLGPAWGDADADADAPRPPTSLSSSFSPSLSLSLAHPLTRTVCRGSRFVVTEQDAAALLRDVLAEGGVTPAPAGIEGASVEIDGTSAAHVLRGDVDAAEQAAVDVEMDEFGVTNVDLSIPFDAAVDSRLRFKTRPQARVSCVVPVALMSCRSRSWGCHTLAFVNVTHASSHCAVRALSRGAAATNLPKPRELA